MSAGSAVTVETVGAYLAYLVEVGFLPSPTKTGERALPVCELSAAQKEALGKIGGRGGTS